MIAKYFRSIISKMLKYLKRIFNGKLSAEEMREKKMREDYNFLIAHGVETEYGYVTLYGEPIIRKAPNSRIRIGKDVILISDSKFNPAGVNHPVILATEKEGAEIILGDGTGFSGTSIVAFSSIKIGNRSGCGVNCNIYDSDFHFLESSKRPWADSRNAPSAPIVIGEDTWITSNVTVLKGVTIGDRAVVGAMSLVNKDVPCDSLVAGIPARLIKTIKNYQ